MALTDLELRQHGAEIKRLLLPTEQLLVLTEFSLADGKDLLEPPPDPRSRLRKSAEKAAEIALYPVAGNPPSLSRMLGGVSADGQTGSWAFRLVGAYRGLLGKQRSQFLLVTDRRLLLASRKIFGKDPDYAVALEIPRDALAQAATEGRPFARGRVVVGFTDGSLIALKLGTYRTGPARSLAQALTSPGTVTPLPL